MPSKEAPMSDPSVLVDAAKRMFIDPDDQERAREFAILFNQGLHLYPVGENKLPAGQWSKGEVNYVTTRADFTDMSGGWKAGTSQAGPSSAATTTSGSSPSTSRSTDSLPTLTCSRTHSTSCRTLASETL